ncbi:hypothetical protein GQ44DRAFT_774793 [Phaeosphaeriaceae sp. PMI808]|nr:hypothetical protein GQ44DRAFT_774793 [Phaeosphaeriaceae sp. PMI808]
MSDSPSNQVTAYSQGSPAFAQQGSVDWVALGRTQYSVSIAILGRLAKAGIDPLTVAFGQAMCARIPIGTHGEKVLSDSMNKLTSKSFVADMLWFGVGVRHILRELVQTSQGCSLIALGAALTEGHSFEVSALVIYEMAKECGGPQELTPSLEQWEALVRVAAPVFHGTTFGLRISQFAKFGMLRPEMPANSKESANPHPTDLAKVLLSIGQIVHGSLQSVSVQGGCCCSWIAAWADSVLGLRVLVRKVNGEVAYANYNLDTTFAQVEVTFLGNSDPGRVLCVQSSYLVRSGEDFIKKCFTGIRESMGFQISEFRLGRLKWETMLSDVFGAHFEALMCHTNGKPSPLRSFQRKEAYDHGTPPKVPLNKDVIFSRMLAITIISFAVRNGSDEYNGIAMRYHLRANELIPELRQCNEQVLFAITNFLKLYGSEETLLDSPKDSKFSNLDILEGEFGDYGKLLQSF